MLILNGLAPEKRFFAVFGGIAIDVEGVFVGFGNPNGIETFSPRLARIPRGTTPASGV
jgi:hypothetical protein